MGRKCLRIESLGQACLMILAQFPRAAYGDGDVRNRLAGELLKVMQNIESFRKKIIAIGLVCCTLQMLILNVGRLQIRPSRLLLGVFASPRQLHPLIFSV